MTDVQIIDFDGMLSAVVRRKGLPVSELRDFMDTAFSALGRAVEAGDVKPAGPAFARYDSQFGETVDLEVGFPVDESLAENIVTEGVDIVPSELPAGRIATTKYVGDYDGLGDAWSSFLAAVKDGGHEPQLPYWEAYDTMPKDGETPTTGLATRIAN